MSDRYTCTAEERELLNLLQCTRIISDYTSQDEAVIRFERVGFEHPSGHTLALSLHAAINPATDGNY